jgi:hypothetical protein
MNKAEVRKIWDELSGVAADYDLKNWVFRGVPSVKYNLVPKIGRKGTFKRKNGSSRNFNEDDEDRAVARFKREARPYLSLEPKGYLEWLSVAQHHGMPTRLMDWTESVFVAAYFAVKEGGFIIDEDGNRKRTDAVIYGIPFPSTVEDSFKKRDSDLTREPFAVVPPHISPRITAQRGLFTYHPNPVKEYAPPDLKKWTINSEACVPIKNILSRGGFNEASLFPDVDGLSRHIGWLMKWGLL